jgi:intein/homing endonuclease
LPNDTFLSVDPVSGDSGWVKHKGLLKLKYTGKMDFFKSHRVNLMTTPDHNHVTISNTNGNLFDLKRGTDLIKSDRLVCTIPNWKGEDKSVVFDGKTYNLKLFAEFMGYWLSEGYLGKASSDTFRIEIAQNKYPIPMISVMEKIFGKSPYYKHNKIVVWVKKSENIELFNFLKGFGKSWEKYVPSFIKEASQEIIKIFLNAYCLGDGSVRLPRGLGTLPTRCFHTSSDKMAADIGELILKIGRKPSYQKSKTRTVKHHNGLYTTKHPCWSISDNKIISSYLKYTPKTQIEYDGFVYDVELEKWHTLFVRRGGKVLLSGNCRHTMFHLPINYGFDAGGNLKYMHYGYNALEEQNKILGKTEHNLQIEELLKHTHDDSCGCASKEI